MTDTNTVPKALSALALQVMRMRRLAPLPQDRESIIRHIESELAEVRAEEIGSQKDMRERGDVLALALNLALAVDEEGVAGLVDIAARAAEKMRLRLDQVELKGKTWGQAKRAAP